MFNPDNILYDGDKFSCKNYDFVLCVLNKRRYLKVRSRQNALTTVGENIKTKPNGECNEI